MWPYSYKECTTWKKMATGSRQCNSMKMQLRLIRSITLTLKIWCSLSVFSTPVSNNTLHTMTILKNTLRSKSRRIRRPHLRRENIPKLIPRISMPGNAMKMISKISVLKRCQSKKIQFVLIISETLKSTNHKINSFKNSWLFKL